MAALGLLVALVQIPLGVLVGLVLMALVVQVLNPKPSGTSSSLRSTGATTTSAGDHGSASSSSALPEEDDLAPPAPGSVPVTVPVSTTAKVVAHASGASCRAGDPLANVYHPYRLQIVDACKSVSGIVRSVRRENDGDIHFDLSLDPAYAGLINDGNTSGQGGALVIELVPADEPGCTAGQPPKPVSGTYDYGICTGADERAPAVGAHVTVVGPYVIDRVHGWAEIHPAWFVAAS